MQLKSVMKTQLQKGFTLVELLIVVIILAILAAIVVPQFASSTDDAKLASLDSTLANVRSAIQLYYQQHGKYPGAAAATGATCAGTAGTGAANTKEAFLSQMTLYTNSAGQACSISDTNIKFGPYLSKEPPADPVTGTVSTIEVVNAGNLTMNATSGDPGGYKYDNKTGKFIVNLAAHESR